MQAVNPNDPTILAGFTFSYLGEVMAWMGRTAIYTIADDANKQVERAGDAYIMIDADRILYKIEYPRSQAAHNWAINFVPRREKGTATTLYGYAAQLVGEVIEQSPGLGVPQTSSLSRTNSIQGPSRPAPVAPVPVDRRESSNGGPSSSTLSSLLAQENARKKRMQMSSIDPSRNAAGRVAALDAMAGIGIRSSQSSIPARSSSPPRSDVSFPGTGRSG